jgi:hypothetical protein
VAPPLRADADAQARQPATDDQHVGIDHLHERLPPLIGA